MNVFYFSSGVGEGAFSNLATCPVPIVAEGTRWNSAEALYQSQFLEDPEQRRMLSADGVLGNLETGMAALGKKPDHWRKKKIGRPEMGGVVAKLALRPANARKLGLKLKPREEIATDEQLTDLFVPILLAKYRANKPWGDKLVATGDALLVEFSRDAVRRTAKGNPPRWSGYVKDGKLHGNNLQGKIHMKVRSILAANA